VATVDQTMIKVQRILTGPMNLRIDLEGERIGVRFTDVSTQVYVRVIDWGKTKDGEPRTLVRVSAPVLREVKATPDLYKNILSVDNRMWFGHIEVDDDTKNAGMVYLTMVHTLLGDYLDEEELRSALFGVLNGADSIDENMQKQFGGKRWADA